MKFRLAGGVVGQSPNLSDVLKLIVRWLIELELNKLNPIFSGNVPELHILIREQA